jgi:two-component system, chemotaxis family, chemotaxis protein CheY
MTGHRPHPQPVFRMALDLARPVLIVDDEELTAELVSTYLAGIGFANVDLAADGLDAWTMMRYRAYGLVISDYGMKPMNGLMFLQAVREDEELRRVRFLLITASSDPEIEARAAALGADAFLRKPFTMKGLREAVERVFGAAAKAA